MKICYYGSYDLNEPHNSTYLAGLQKAGARVLECRMDSAGQRDQAANYKNPVRLLRLLARYVANSLRLAARLCRLEGLDAIIVGYPGYFDLPLAKLCAWRRKIPVLFNVHISLYETLVIDRGYARAGSLPARLLKWYDRLLFKLADAVIVDTEAHGAYFAQLYRLPREKFHRIFIGADALFQPLPRNGHAGTTVLFYGTFIPLQGIEHIIRAAHLLENESDIRFEIIGRGQTKAQMVQLSRQLGLKNIDFIEWVDREELVRRIAAADICLGGQFGRTEKADLVIGYKCFQMIAAGRPVVVADSAGNRELLRHGENCYMCRAGDPEALAGAIRALQQDPALGRRIAAGARETYVDFCSAEIIGRDLLALVQKIISAAAQ